MASKNSQMFSDAELWLMELLWLHGPATFDEAVMSVPRRLALPSNTIYSGLQELEIKGLIRSERRGETSVYSPVMQ